MGSRPRSLRGDKRQDVLPQSFDRRSNPFSFHAPNAFSHGASAHSEVLHELRFSESLTRNISSFIKLADYRSHDARGRAIREARRVRYAILASHRRAGNLLTTRATCRHGGSATAQVNKRRGGIWTNQYRPTPLSERAVPCKRKC